MKKFKFIRLLFLVAAMLPLSSCGFLVDTWADQKVYDGCFNGMEQAFSANGVIARYESTSTLETFIESCIGNRDLWGQQIQKCYRDQTTAHLMCEPEYPSSAVRGNYDVTSRLISLYGSN